MDVRTNFKTPRAKRLGNFKRRRVIFVWTVLAVPIVHWCVFWLYVNVDSILLAFKLPVGTWTHLNFKTVFDNIRTGDIGVAIKNTLLYFGSGVLVTMPSSLFISFFLYKRIAGYRFFRVMFYLPGIISAVALTAVYKEFLKPNGVLTAVLGALGAKPPAVGYLYTDATATGAILGYCIWTGLAANMLLFCGTMERIPADVVESAKIEGISPLHEIVSITLPLIWPTISTLLVFAMTGLFGASGPILLFTNGRYGTTTISFWIFQQVYEHGNYNIVSAAGLVFTVVGVPVILFFRWLMERVGNDEY
ncbi:MAG: sugar ABC transporter permease [Firmicutes bacterium]|nr:sugar ABC transporter permease [Bacillota bacterium]